MPESLDAFSELRAIRARVEGIEHRQEMLVRAHSDEILRAVWEYFDRDRTLAAVYIVVNGKRTQREIVTALKARGITTTQQNVSLKLAKLKNEMGLIEVGRRHAEGTIYVKSEIDRILHLTPKVERRLSELKRAGRGRSRAKPQKR